LDSKISFEQHSIEILIKEKDHLKNLLSEGVQKPPKEDAKEELEMQPGLIPENQDFLRQIKRSELFSKKADAEKER